MLQRPAVAAVTVLTVVVLTTLVISAGHQPLQMSSSIHARAVQSSSPPSTKATSTKPVREVVSPSTTSTPKSTSTTSGTSASTTLSVNVAAPTTSSTSQTTTTTTTHSTSSLSSSSTSPATTTSTNSAPSHTSSLTTKSTAAPSSPAKPSSTTRPPAPTSTKVTTTSSPRTVSTSHPVSTTHTTSQSSPSTSIKTTTTSSSTAISQSSLPSSTAFINPDRTPAPTQATPSGTSQKPQSDHVTSQSFLHNTKAAALVFTFVALIALLILSAVGFLLWKRHLRRRNRIAISDMEEFRGFQRTNSTASSRRGAISSNSSARFSGVPESVQEWHYQPQRLAGQPIRHQTFGMPSATMDPIHHAIYPDPLPRSPMDQPRSYTLFADAPSSSSKARPMPPPPRPQPPQTPFRPSSPDSEYNDSMYSGIQRRPYMIDRKPVSGR